MSVRDVPALLEAAEESINKLMALYARLDGAEQEHCGILVFDAERKAANNAAYNAVAALDAIRYELGLPDEEESDDEPANANANGEG